MRMKMKRENLLSKFRPVLYELEIGPSAGKSNRKVVMKLIGKKIDRPSRRITLHQKGLKINRAAAVRTSKRGDQAHQIIRINHLPSFEEVRLHSNELMFPGDYELELEYSLPEESAKELASGQPPSRALTPSIDEPEAWSAAKIVLKS